MDVQHIVLVHGIHWERGVEPFGGRLVCTCGQTYSMTALGASFALDHLVEHGLKGE